MQQDRVVIYVHEWLREKWGNDATVGDQRERLVESIKRVNQLIAELKEINIQEGEKRL
jgi:hypothetical protein